MEQLRGDTAARDRLRASKRGGIISFFNTIYVSDPTDSSVSG
jgi:hypothetical protein